MRGSHGLPPSLLGPIGKRCRRQTVPHMSTPEACPTLHPKGSEARCSTGSRPESSGSPQQHAALTLTRPGLCQRRPFGTMPIHPVDEDEDGVSGLRHCPPCVFFTPVRVADSRVRNSKTDTIMGNPSAQAEVFRRLGAVPLFLCYVGFMTPQSKSLEKIRTSSRPHPCSRKSRKASPKAS